MKRRLIVISFTAILFVSIITLFSVKAGPKPGCTYPPCLYCLNTSLQVRINSYKPKTTWLCSSIIWFWDIHRATFTLHTESDDNGSPSNYEGNFEANELGFEIASCNLRFPSDITIRVSGPPYPMYQTQAAYSDCVRNNPGRCGSASCVKKIPLDPIKCNTKAIIDIVMPCDCNRM